MVREIFRLLDETPEVDDGYVTLVNAVKDGGTIKESEKRTGMWHGSTITRTQALPTTRN